MTQEIQPTAENPRLQETQVTYFFKEKLPPIKNFKGADIISAEQFDPINLQVVFYEADRAKEGVEKRLEDKCLSGFILATLFYQPSTRTRLSFEAAMQRLGGKVISESAVEFSSMIKGEKLPDTVRVVEGYADVIALRHPIEGSAKIAAEIAAIPIINAGDGPGEHPTQALLDLYTIQQKFGQIDGLTITFLGDLKKGRTVHSLVKLLSYFEVQINFVAPQFLQIPQDFIGQLQQKGIKLTKANYLNQLESDFDVIYITRLQEEFYRDDPNSSAIIANLKNSYNLPSDFTEKSKAVIMHPLPRVNEIPAEIDSSHQAIYFEQSRNGLFIRMALLKLVLLGN